MGPVEFLYYWLHRLLHHHYLYSRYHSHHHSSIVTEPITCKSDPTWLIRPHDLNKNISWYNVDQYSPLILAIHDDIQQVLVITTWHYLLFWHVHRSCDSSIRRAHILLHSICNTIDNDYFDRDSLCSIPCWLYHLHWRDEQHGSLQLWTRSQMALHHFPPSQVPHVHPIVSLDFLQFQLLILTSLAPFLFINGISFRLVNKKHDCYERL